MEYLHWTCWKAALWRKQKIGICTKWGLFSAGRLWNLQIKVSGLVHLESNWIFHISTCLSPLPLSNSHPRIDITRCGVWGWVESERVAGVWGLAPADSEVRNLHLITVCQPMMWLCRPESLSTPLSLFFLSLSLILSISADARALTKRNFWKHNYTPKMLCSHMKPL